MNTALLVLISNIFAAFLIPLASAQSLVEPNITSTSVPAEPSTPLLTEAQLDHLFPRFPAGPSMRQSDAAKRVAKRLGRGINLGNMLETPLATGEWGVRPDSQLDYLQYVDLAKQAGFTHIRLPVRWSNHAAVTADATLHADFAQRVDRIINHALAAGLAVVLNMHHYRQLDGTALEPGENRVAPDVVDLRMLSMWRQIAWRYQNHSEQLLFEIYNEPHGRIDSRWNSLLSRALREIRVSNPTRIVVVGPTPWNSAHTLDSLELPACPHLLVTVHNYDPFSFTHQGATWVKPVPAIGTRCCDNSQVNQVLNSLEKAQRWGQDRGYSIYLGEFGAYEKASMADRVAYTRIVSRAATELGFSWAYWELAAGFGVFDPALHTWRQSLLDALLLP